MKKYYPYLYLLLAVVFITLSQILFNPDNKISYSQKDALKFTQILNQKEAVANSTLATLSNQLDNVSVKVLNEQPFNQVISILQKLDVAIYVYFQDTLLLWPGTQVPIELELDKGDYSSGLIKLRNGWYERIELSKNKFRLIAYILIKQEYPFNNQYLKSGFAPCFGDINGDITRVKRTKGVSIDTNTGLSFTIIAQQTKSHVQINSILMSLLALCGIIFLVLFVYYIISVAENKFGFLIAFGILIFFFIGLRCLMLYFGFPHVFTHVELFNPYYYATSYIFPSLGDFFLNVLVIFAIVHYLHLHFLKYPIQKTSKIYFTGSLLFFTIVLFLSYYVNELVIGIVRDSNIQFDVRNFFILNAFSLFSTLFLGLLLCAYYLLLQVAINWLLVLAKEKKLLLIIPVLIYVVVMALFVYPDTMFFLWPVALCLVLFFSNPTKKDISFQKIVIYLLIFSAFGANCIEKFTRIKEKAHCEYLADKLSTDKDPVMEYLYFKTEEKLKKDNFILNNYDTLKNGNNSLFESQIKDDYLNRDWDNYDITTIVNLTDTILTTTDKNTFLSLPPLDEIASIGRVSDFSNNLYYVGDIYKNISYVAKLPIPNHFPETIYLLFTSKFVPGELGFPELLLDKSAKLASDLANYSFARYVNNVLTNQHGELRYENNPLHYINQKHNDVYNHVVKTFDNNTTIVISNKKKTLLESLTTFSYLFVIFGVLAVVLLIIKNAKQGTIRHNISLKNKIQFVLLGLILTSMVLLGVGIYISNDHQNSEKNKRILGEKIRSVLIELTHKQATGGDNYVNYITKFSNVFFSDINMYNLDGTLLKSSRPEIFEEGLICRKMNPEAYIELAVNKKSEFIHNEEIGSMNYLSAYVPFRTSAGNVLSYLNLPYFSKQDELKKETSEFLITLVNIFVILFVLSLIAALFISNWIMRPLLIVQQNLATIKLGSKNQPIAYSGHDEVGTLIKQYNLVVSELEKNAILLARSERENAWREMAKQVAHEIKNPLTPMKLSVQHLQRSLDPNDKNWQVRFNKFSETMVEQIDTLSRIASEFSNFAKMPIANNKVIDLVKILSSSSELFEKTSGMIISFTNKYDTEALVFADKDQLVRVFNNLIKNAVQSIPNNRKGRIFISLNREGGSFIVEIKDNGSGIASDKIDKIFIPNFTTKSSGMGLGLTMVKNIVENASGIIWFNTIIEVGTSFYVSLPVYVKDKPASNLNGE